MLANTEHQLSAPRAAMVILCSVNYLGWFIAVLQPNQSRTYMITSFTNPLAVWVKSQFQKKNSLIRINFELQVTDTRTETNFLILVHNCNDRIFWVLLSFRLPLHLRSTKIYVVGVKITPQTSFQRSKCSEILRSQKRRDFVIVFRMQGFECSS